MPDGTPSERRILELHELRIVSNDGTLKGVFASSPDGLPYLQLYDSKGRVRIQAQIEESDSAHFVLWGDTQAPAAAIAVTAGGERGLTVYDKDGLPVLQIIGQADGRIDFTFTPADEPREGDDSN